MGHNGRALRRQGHQVDQTPCEHLGRPSHSYSECSPYPQKGYKTETQDQGKAEEICNQEGQKGYEHQKVKGLDIKFNF